MAVEIPGYDSFEEIGRGGFAVVYKARQRSVDRLVAVKVLDAHSLPDLARFEREARAMGALSWHPNVVAVHDSGVTPAGAPYLVMEHLPGGSLADRLGAGPIPWDEAVNAVVQLADAVHTAHEHGLLHRDVKPDNALIGRLGQVKLGDFGIAALQGVRQTATGSVTATVAYAPPEVLRGQRATERSDIYSLGATLHELLAGAKPFAGGPEDHLVAVMNRIFTEPPPRLPPSVPVAVARVVEQAMAKDPADRPATAAELASLLRQARAAAPMADVRPRPPAAPAPEPAAPPEPAHPPQAPGVAVDVLVAPAHDPRRRILLRVDAAAWPGVPALVAALAAQVGVSPGPHTTAWTRRDPVPWPESAPASTLDLWRGDVVLVGTAPEPAPPPAPYRLLVVGGPCAGRTEALAAGHHEIGRDPALASIPIDDESVSRRHLGLDVTEDGVTASDLGSTNGTFLDGAVLAPATPVVRGDVLGVGDTLVAVGEPAPARPLLRAAGGRVRWAAGPRRGGTGGGRWGRRRPEAGTEIAAGVPDGRRRAIARRDLAPSSAHAAAAVEDLAGLWGRRPGDPDHLALRLGTADLVGPDGGTDHDVPLVAALGDVPVVVVVGDPRWTDAVLRGVVVQAAAWHGPGDVTIAVAAGADPGAWTWVGWLPHAEPWGAAAAGTLGTDDLLQRLAGSPNRRPGHRAVAVVPDVLPSTGPAIARAVAGGVAVVCGAHRTADVPDGAALVVDASGGPAGATATDRRTGVVTAGVVLDGIDVERATDAALSLAALVEAG